MNIPLNFIILFGISGGEILIVLLLVLVLFGPKKIPEIARTIGKGINEVKKVQRDINAEINRYTDEIEKPAKEVNNDLDGFKKQYYNPESDIKKEDMYPADSSEEIQEGDAKTGHTNKNEDVPYPYNTQDDYLNHQYPQSNDDTSSSEELKKDDNLS